MARLGNSALLKECSTEEFESPQVLDVNWWARQGSNLRPTGYEPAALPLSYGPPAYPKPLCVNVSTNRSFTPRPPLYTPYPN